MYPYLGVARVGTRLKYMWRESEQSRDSQSLSSAGGSAEYNRALRYARLRVQNYRTPYSGLLRIAWSTKVINPVFSPPRLVSAGYVSRTPYAVGNGKSFGAGSLRSGTALRRFYGQRAPLTGDPVVHLMLQLPSNSGCMTKSSMYQRTGQ